MYAPIYLPQAVPPSPDVLAIEARIMAAEGAYHVEGRYYANAFDADRMRRLVAERLVREAVRRDAWYATHPADQPTTSQQGVPVRTFAAAKPRVLAWLTPRERGQVEAATDGLATVSHEDALGAMAGALKAGRADAVLLSADRIRPVHVADLARLVRGFPGVSVAGVVADTTDAQALAAAVLLGRAGVATVLDCRTPSGWAGLRALLTPRQLPNAFGRQCIAAVLDELRSRARDGDTSHEQEIEIADGLTRFVVAVFAPDLTSTKQLAVRLGVGPSTLASRFYRAGLPSPKRYLATARLVWAAHLGETPGLSISAIAVRLDASSPQSFHRTVRTLTGQSAVQFRRATTGAAMLHRFCATLVTPYRETLSAFDPLGANSVSYVAPRAASSTPVMTLGRVA